MNSCMGSISCTNKRAQERVTKAVVRLYSYYIIRNISYSQSGLCQDMHGNGCSSTANKMADKRGSY